MKITSKYTDIQLTQVDWMLFNLKQQSRCLYIVEKPVINALPQKYIKFWYFNHFNQISQKALGGFWRNYAFFNPWKALFKTYHVSVLENCKKILTPSRPLCPGCYITTCPSIISGHFLIRTSTFCPQIARHGKWQISWPLVIFLANSSSIVNY